MREFLVTGRRAPCEAAPSPRVYRMRLFADNDVVAKSRFWYFMKRLEKVKKATGEILQVKEVFPKKETVAKTFGFTLRYESRTGVHNMYKEYRAVSSVDAVQKMYSEMGGQHRARFRNLHIIDVKELNAAEVRRPTPFLKATVAFPKASRLQRSDRKSKIVAKRPNVF